MDGNGDGGVRPRDRPTSDTAGARTTSQATHAELGHEYPPARSGGGLDSERPERHSDSEQLLPVEQHHPAGRPSIWDHVFGRGFMALAQNEVNVHASSIQPDVHQAGNELNMVEVRISPPSDGAQPDDPAPGQPAPAPPLQSMLHSPSFNAPAMPFLGTTFVPELSPGDAAGGLPGSRRRQELTPGLAAVSSWLESLFPFVLLLTAVFLYEHSRGILVFIWLTVCLSQANKVMRQQVALKEQRTAPVLCALVLFLAAQNAAAYLLLGGGDLWRALLFLPFSSELPTLLDVVWAVTLNDLAGRALATGAKAAALLAAARALHRRRVARGLACIESVAALYRELLPVPIWYVYLSAWPEGELVHGLARGCYVTFKLVAIVCRATHLRECGAALLSKATPYGRYATLAEAAEQAGLAAEEAAAVTCTICCEALRGPVRLACGHIFCEDCVAEWMQRERTCPLCRSIVRTSREHVGGDGATTLLPTVF